MFIKSTAKTDENGLTAYQGYQKELKEQFKTFKAKSYDIFKNELKESDNDEDRLIAFIKAIDLFADEAFASSTELVKKKIYHQN